MARRTVIGLAVAATVALTLTGAGVAYATGVIPFGPAISAETQQNSITPEAPDTPATPELPPSPAPRPSPSSAPSTKSLSCAETGPAQAAVERYLDSLRLRSRQRRRQAVSARLRRDREVPAAVPDHAGEGLRGQGHRHHCAPARGGQPRKM
ncbi:hypothetical protein [Fodinicola feengrottensis]|uniref:hypothetical protein n=1 Tax=Fodinicola feengrottensis TaxID=435914 RepID=UPI0013D35F3C|nr:hypothetical protein [Fodinicola feengrottensis]